MTNTKTEMERLARVLWRNRWIEPEPETLPPEQLGPAQSDWDHRKEVYERDVRVILQALSEPSEGMVAAARMSIMFTRGEPKDAVSSAVFTAMIKHILEEGEAE